MNNKIITLKDRQIIEVKGDDRKKFLQSLISNDINKIDNNLIYSALLTPQGRFLYDFFIFESEERIFLDCYQPRVEEIFKKLNFYKLKSSVEINIALNFKVISIIDAGFDLSLLPNDCLIYSDPRNKEMGYRGYISKSTAPNEEINLVDNYHFKRIMLKIAEGEYDLTYDKSFILEYGFDNLNAIDYQKGCYLGQEVTARTHYRGQIRKKLLHVQIDSLTRVDKGSKINYQDRLIGEVLSSVFNCGKLNALALIKIEDELDINELSGHLQLMGNKITIIS